MTKVFKPKPTITYGYWELKNLCIDNPDVMWQLIKKHRWQYLQFVTKKDMPKLFLIKDFIKRPEKYENYWQKKMYGPEEDQLTLF